VLRTGAVSEYFSAFVFLLVDRVFCGDALFQNNGSDSPVIVLSSLRRMKFKIEGR
jgi:hypothetical protein